jgi:hypothetical protein
MMLYIYLTTVVSAYIWPSSGQNINHESKYVSKHKTKYAIRDPVMVHIDLCFIYGIKIK